MAENGDGRRASSVGEAFVEPVIRVLEALHEEVTKHGVEAVDDLTEDSNALIYRSCLNVRDEFTAPNGLYVGWEMCQVRRHEIIMERDCIRYKFDDTRGRCQRQYLIGSDSEVPLSSCLLCL